LAELSLAYQEDPSNLNSYLIINYLSLVIANLYRASAILQRQIASGSIVSQSTINVFLEHNQAILRVINSLDGLKNFDYDQRIISEFTDYLNSQTAVA